MLLSAKCFALKQRKKILNICSSGLPSLQLLPHTCGNYNGLALGTDMEEERGREGWRELKAPAVEPS